MLNSIVVILAASVATLVLISPKLAKARMWRAMITPLASIIGSGFLVIGPLLLHAYGSFAPLIMFGLCAVSFAFGSAIRFNIAHAEGSAENSRAVTGLEALSSWALAFAYVISVAYYLNLFGAFAVSLTDVADQTTARLVTSAALVFIALIGATRGFQGLERSEQVAVGIKLAIIAGLLAGFGVYAAEQATDGGMAVSPLQLSGWPALTLAFGLIVTVQGFETSRYLGAEYDKPTRIRSMRYAQFLSAGIYLVYAALIAFTFMPGSIGHSETAIIELTRAVAPILPALLVLAALAAQLSAAIADTGGSGGLVCELSRQRIAPGVTYVALALIGLALTWAFDIFTIIAHASRAFAAYYGLQALIAALTARRTGHGLGRQALYLALAIVAAAIVIFGTPAEGG